ncbi:MAG: RNA polymerase sigma factor [Gammaproteobacteria bacterium]|jgi:RNA polymerase sigma-70 factor (ECF subfamily)
MDDKQLLILYIEGDESALTHLVERYQKELYGFVFRQVGNHADAADLTQKVFVNVFLKADQFNGDSSFKTWLYQIAINQCKNHFRSKDRQRLDDVELESLPLVAEENFELELEMAEHQLLLRQAVDRLPAKQRMTVRLRLYQECTFVEIAEIMTASVGTAKAHYHQAVTTLRKILKKEHYELPEL